MQADRIAPGLWRWTAPHPDWVAGGAADSPEDWEELVGCVLYVHDGAAVFIDPLLPADTDRFWAGADERVRGARVFVLTTIRWHRRSREQVRARYRASVSRAKRELPVGVRPIMLRGTGETLFWLPELQALVCGDRILGGRGGGLRLCPESWMESERLGLDGLRALLRPVAELPIERVIVSHGAPVLHDGRRALREIVYT
jgi:hypothetical protein